MANESRKYVSDEVAALTQVEIRTFREYASRRVPNGPTVTQLREEMTDHDIRVILTAAKFFFEAVDEDCLSLLL